MFDDMDYSDLGLDSESHILVNIFVIM